MAYQFDAQHADGLAGEAFLDALFSRWYRIRPASAAQQRRGIDRWFRTATRRLAVEYKTDHTAETPADAPQLHIDALALFGGVDVKHDKH